MDFAGRGVFLKESIKKNQFICEYSGELISAAEGYRREETLGDSSVFRYFFSSNKEELWYVNNAFTMNNVKCTYIYVFIAPDASIIVFQLVSFI